MHALGCGWPCRGWTTACCLLGLLTAACFLSSGAVLLLNAASCLPLDFSPAKRLNSLALFSNSFCFSLSSCKRRRDKSNTEQEASEQHAGWNLLSTTRRRFNLAELCYTWISLRYRATSFRMLSPFLSWQFINFSSATSLSITDGSEGLRETNKARVGKKTRTTIVRRLRGFDTPEKCSVGMRGLIWCSY